MTERDEIELMEDIAAVIRTMLAPIVQRLDAIERQLKPAKPKGRKK